MSGRSTRSKVPTRLLFADPFQKRLKRRRSSKRHQRRIELFQLAVREDRVQLLVARLAERRSLLRLSPARFGVKMMQRDQLRWNLAMAQSTADNRFNITRHWQLIGRLEMPGTQWPVEQDH